MDLRGAIPSAGSSSSISIADNDTNSLSLVAPPALSMKSRFIVAEGDSAIRKALKSQGAVQEFQKLCTSVFGAILNDADCALKQQQRLWISFGSDNQVKRQQLDALTNSVQEIRNLNSQILSANMLHAEIQEVSLNDELQSTKLTQRILSGKVENSEDTTKNTNSTCKAVTNCK